MGFLEYDWSSFVDSNFLSSLEELVDLRDEADLTTLKFSFFGGKSPFLTS